MSDRQGDNIEARVRILETKVQFLENAQLRAALSHIDDSTNYDRLVNLDNTVFDGEGG